MLLVIDDNKDLCKIICRMLEVFGYRVVGVNSGEEGIEKARELKPRAILCDIGMEGMTGYDVVKYIRGQEDLKHTYMIAISGYSTEADKNLCLQAGFDVHLKKPIEFDKLKEVLEAEYRD